MRLRNRDARKITVDFSKRPFIGFKGYFADCSHVIVTAFVVESIQNPEGFSSIKCDSYENYLVGVCATNDRVALGGDLVGHQGIYFFETNPEKPYSKN